MQRILSLQQLHAEGIDGAQNAGDPGSDCSYISCNTISTCSENACTTFPATTEL